MDLQVHIVCSRCHQRKVVIVNGGGWDIKDVVHQCEGELGERYVEGRPLRHGDFHVTFDPVRPVF